MPPRARNKSRPGSRSSATARDPDGTKKALLESALARFEEFGFDATPVQLVVDDAGLTKGAFYHYFKSKEDLLRALHDKFIDVHLERLNAVLTEQLSPDEALRRIVIEVLLEPLSIYKAEITVFLQERRFLSDGAFAEVKKKRDEFERRFVGLIEQGMDEGNFERIGPPQLVAFGIIGMCAWPYTWLDPMGAVSAREIGEIFASILLDGLRPKR
jgi:AcrR family transcriptional regulator